MAMKKESEYVYLHPALHDKNFGLDGISKMLEWDEIQTFMFILNNPGLYKYLFSGNNQFDY